MEEALLAHCPEDCQVLKSPKESAKLNIAVQPNCPIRYQKGNGDFRLQFIQNHGQQLLQCLHHKSGLGFCWNTNPNQVKSQGNWWAANGDGKRDDQVDLQR